MPKTNHTSNQKPNPSGETVPLNTQPIENLPLPHRRLLNFTCLPNALATVTKVPSRLLLEKVTRHAAT
jgi:hypothetical protein